jgi:hypothetical protein
LPDLICDDRVDLAGHVTIVARIHRFAPLKFR